MSLTEQVNVRLSKDDFEVLKKIAKEQNRAPAYIVRMAIKDLLEAYA